MVFSLLKSGETRGVGVDRLQHGCELTQLLVKKFGMISSMKMTRSRSDTSQSKRILVIDDEPGILDFVEELLSFRFRILKALDASTGLALAEAERPDLIILDLGLQNQSGHDICRVLRERPETKHIPILIYTGSDDIENLTQAFEQGADDYVVKNARPRELVARVLAKIRRLEEKTDDPEVIPCGNLVLDSARLEATLDGKTLPLSVLEFNLLRFFVINKDRVMSRKQILDGVWKDAVVSNRTIDTHMVYLRKKLSGFTHSLATVYGAGYILRDSGRSATIGSQTMTAPPAATSGGPSVGSSSGPSGQR